MITKNKKLLFWGELPPKTVHGISISNQRILDGLSDEFEIIKVIDYSAFGGLLQKLYSFFYSIFLLFFHALFHKCNYFYLNMPMSRLGLWKVYIVTRVVQFIIPNVKVIAHLHRGDFLDFLSNKNNQGLFFKFFKRLFKLIVLSSKSKQELLEYDGLEGKKICVLFNTIEPISKPTSLVEEGNSDSRYLYCLCNYIESKRIHSLVLIANQLKYPFLLNGFVSSKSYLTRLAHIDTGGFCSFGDVIHGIEKENMLRGAKASVLPSLNEGMPLVLLESLAQGTPVICFDVGFISDYLGSDYPGLVHELTDGALADRIHWVENLSKEDYLNFRRISFELFWDNFDPNNIRINTKKLFRSFND